MLQLLLLLLLLFLGFHLCLAHECVCMCVNVVQIRLLVYLSDVLVDYFLLFSFWPFFKSPSSPSSTCLPIDRSATIYHPSSATAAAWSAALWTQVHKIEMVGLFKFHSINCIDWLVALCLQLLLLLYYQQSCWNITFKRKNDSFIRGWICWSTGNSCFVLNVVPCLVGVCWRVVHILLRC